MATEADLKWDKKTHGEMLKSARTRENMSRAMLADKLNVAYLTILNWEEGKNAPQSDSTRKLVKLFGADAFDPERQSEAEEVSPLAAWVLETREKKKLTRHQLAQKAGISGPTIWSIETGKTANPQESTIQKLEKALGESLPEDIAKEVDATAEIGVEGVGALTDFDPHAVEELPAVPGIYVLYDVSERPIYVGESGDIAARIKNRQNGHWDKFWYREPIVQKGAYVRVEEEKLRKQIERVMIKFLKSNAVINRQGVERVSESDEAVRK